MIKKILIGILAILVLLISGLSVYVVTQPAEFRVTRTAMINAPADAVFAQVNDLPAWQAWSPWAKRDPNIKNTYSGPTSGAGASHAWAGNQEVGEGRMTILESRPGALVRLKLEFFKPFEGTNTVDFTFQPRGNQTEVTWSMYGPNTLMGKIMSLFIDMDAMCGSDFEKGLESLNQVATQPGVVRAQ